MEELFTNDCMTWSGCNGGQKQHILKRTLLLSGNKIPEKIRKNINQSIETNEKCFVLYNNLGSGSSVSYNIFRNYYIIERSHGNGSCYDYEYKSHNITKYENLKILSLCHNIDITRLVDEFEKQEKEYEISKNIETNKELILMFIKLTNKEVECDNLYDEIKKLKEEISQYHINFKTFTERIYELETIIKQNY